MYKSLRDVKELGYLSVDFYLTKSCNKTCHYCTAWTKEMRNLVVDMEFLSELLKWFSPYPTRINLLGGEPALVKNLPEVIDEIKKHENLVPSVLSNSLVRNRYPFILEDPEIIYIEHLVLDFHEDRIEKLGPKTYEFFGENDKNNYNLIIKTPGFYEYSKKHRMDIYHNNTMLKEYNSRSPTYDVIEQAPEFDRKICSAFPLVPVIDFEIRKIRHCSKKVINGSRQFELTQENIDKMMNFELFKYEDYCRNCTETIPKRSQDHILQVLEVME